MQTKIYPPEHWHRRAEELRILAAEARRANLAGHSVDACLPRGDDHPPGHLSGSVYGQFHVAVGLLYLTAHNPVG